MNEQILLTDSVQDVLVKMSEGNPGALMVCMNLLQSTPIIDPDNIMGGIGIILSLDDMGIRGSRIWQLFKDICKENLISLCAVMRGRQLGKLYKGEITNAIDTHTELDIGGILEFVKSQLPDFDKEPK